MHMSGVCHGCYVPGFYCVGNHTYPYDTGWHGEYYALKHSIPFPLVPKPATFIARNYTSRPTFFGCDARLTSTNDTRAPIIAYFPNAPYSSYSNITFFDNTMPVPRVLDIWNNTFDLVTQGAGRLDPEWPACLACAAVERSLEKLQPPMTRTQQCERCFQRYCWDGTEEPEASGHVDVDLEMVLEPGVSYQQWDATVGQTLH